MEKYDSSWLHHISPVDPMLICFLRFILPLDWTCILKSPAPVLDVSELFFPARSKHSKSKERTRVIRLTFLPVPEVFISRT